MFPFKKLTKCISGKSLLETLQRLEVQVNGMNSELWQLRSEVLKTRQTLIGGLMNLRRHLRRPYADDRALSPTPAEMRDGHMPLDEQFAELEKRAPKAYELWRALLDVNAGGYEGLPVDSCSVAGHPTAALFRGFITPYLHGRVLDIGCGPQPVPAYLADVPVQALYGVDPLSAADGHPFCFFRGLAEFLPWKDDQFEVVTVATSLDHVLLPDVVFGEVCRVLCPSGLFLAWVGYVEGAEPYDPTIAEIKPVDDYHLFHYDRIRFLESVEPHFIVEEEFSLEGFVNAGFFALRPR
jgi:SAM-dependent methyltransferase